MSMKCCKFAVELENMRYDTPHNDTRGEGAADGENEAAAARGCYELDESQS